MLIRFWKKFLHTSMVFLRAYISCIKFSNVFLCAYISLTKSYTYFGYNIVCAEDDLYKFFVCILVRKLVTDGLDVNIIVTVRLDENITKNIEASGNCTDAVNRTPVKISMRLKTASYAMRQMDTCAV